MATGPQVFYALWQKETIREKLFDYLHKEDICNVRLANSACCNLVTKRLFLRVNVTFAAHTFTRQSRIQALSCIGHHIEHLTFNFPHSDATFLPPLIHPETGKEIAFLYTPHTSMASVLSRPKFANSELGIILTEQYPPLFHAASNVPSFINAMKHVPNMRHLTIKTPGQDAKERYRRDIVDYALISLRISLERTRLNKLTKLTLSSVHPSAFIYLRHVPGFGCSPAAGRRWKQIRKLHISAESWDFYGPSPGLDHLKMMEDYIRNFSEYLEKFTFTWLGKFKGPCPVSLAFDPLFAPPRSARKLFNEVTSPMSPLPPAPGRKPIHFRKLKYLSIRNATMNAPQVAELVEDHQHCVREFDFENVVLINGGSWDEALAPLMDNPSRSDHWSRHSTGSIDVDVMGSFHSAPSPSAAASFSSQEALDDVPTPSAAVAAVSQELFETELGGGEGYGSVEGYVEQWQHQQSQHEEDEVEETYDDLDSDLEAARKASLTFSTKLKKRRITKRRRRRKPGHEHRHEEQHEETPTKKSSRSHHQQKTPTKPSRSRDFQQEETPTKSSRSHHRRHHHKKTSKEEISVPEQESVEELYRPPTEPPHPLHYRSRSLLFGELENVHSRQSSSHSNSNSSHRLFGELDSTHSNASKSSQRLLFGEMPPPLMCTEEPELSHSPIDETCSSSIDGDYFRPPTPVDTIDIGLMASASDMNISAPILDTQPSMPTLLQPTVYDPTAMLCNEITAVQRDIEAEEAHRLLAEDADMRMSALKKAKEAVLSKLSEQFYGYAEKGGKSAMKSSSPSRKHKDGAGVRFRIEGLFGKSSSAVSSTLDHRSMDVPILISRA